MFGVTTACVERAREILERAGYEVLVFHATGNGGQAMESLISEGLIAGVLDITTTELADEQVGGFLSAGPDRLTAAGKAGIPQVVSTGALDMANFYAPESVPAKFKDRLFYKHNANVTLMRTTAEENAQIGAGIARKLSAATGPVAVLLPKRGVSAIDKAGPAVRRPRRAQGAPRRDPLRSGSACGRGRASGAAINEPASPTRRRGSCSSMMKNRCHSWICTSMIRSSPRLAEADRDAEKREQIVAQALALETRPICARIS